MSILKTLKRGLMLTIYSIGSLVLFSIQNKKLMKAIKTIDNIHYNYTTLVARNSDIINFDYFYKQKFPKALFLDTKYTTRLLKKRAVNSVSAVCCLKVVSDRD